MACLIRTFLQESLPKTDPCCEALVKAPRAMSPQTGLGFMKTRTLAKGIQHPSRCLIQPYKPLSNPMRGSFEGGSSLEPAIL